MEKFKNIFSGLNSAYGQTKNTGQFDEDGKHETKSVTTRSQVTNQLWKDHLDGKEPALGIVPIREDNKCKWGCIDIDAYPFDHKKFLQNIRSKNLPLILFRSKSGGAHVFLFTKEFVPASLMREKLRKMASILGYSKAEIFPKQDYIRIERGDTGSFLNLPYHKNGETVRYAFKDDGTKATLEEFYELYDKYSVIEKDLINFKSESVNDDMLLEAPPCLVALLTQKLISKGTRNNGMYNVAVYLKKRFPDNWMDKLHEYNVKYIPEPLTHNEIQNTIDSLSKKSYQYKCKEDPIVSYCDAKTCSRRKFGVGDDLPSLEISSIRKFTSDPPIYYATVDGETVEVDDTTLHEADKFSIACMNQIGKPMIPVGKIIWRKMLAKLFTKLEEIKAPPSAKTDYLLQELVVEFVSRSKSKSIEDVKRNIAHTENGYTMFMFKPFWKFVQKSNLWNLPYHKTIKKLESVFGAKDVTIKINGKSTHVLKMLAVDPDKLEIRETKMKEPSFS